MKYFTKDELVDISRELIENPTRETLRKLNEKYNMVAVEPDTLLKEPTANFGIEPTLAVEHKENEEVIPNEVTEQNYTLPSDSFQPIELQQTTPTFINGEVAFQNQGFEIPELETNSFINQNNNPINFDGNLFNSPTEDVNNLMQTTDNFNVVQNTMPSTEVPVTPAPFFITTPELSNNPIPVSDQMNNNVPNQSPSMFGQFMQNNM